MKEDILDEIIECLPKDRSLFHYFKGQYAFQLLSYITKKESSVKAVKQSHYQKLLNQPDIKLLLSKLGNGKLTPEVFQHVWKENSLPFILTIDKWGDNNQWDYQTTRNGCNLVLQLNFSEQHNRRYQKLIKPKHDFVLNYSGHPVMNRTKRAL